MTTQAPPVDLTVQRPVELAVRDFGGDGPDVVLVHGAGRTLVDFTPLAGLLPGYRLVALDLRGHGRSGDGPWTWDLVLDDLEAVVDDLGLRTPAVVGHSLGGMIAALWGARHPDCPAAVNLDGHGSGRPDQYDGLDPELVAARLVEIRDYARTVQAPVLAPDQVDAVIAAQRPVAEAMGVDPDILEAGLRRSLVTTPEGVRGRPVAALATPMLAAVDSLDMLATWAACRCPLLVVNATAATAVSAPGAPEWLAELMPAYRAGLTRTLGQLAADHPHLTVELFDGDHGLLLNQPAATAALVRRYLDAQLG